MQLIKLLKQFQILLERFIVIVNPDVVGIVWKSQQTYFKDHVLNVIMINSGCTTAVAPGLQAHSTRAMQDSSKTHYFAPIHLCE